MAMTRPIVNQISAFDATNGARISFRVIGGSQVVKNKITIRNNETNIIVYENTLETYKLENIIPQQTLTNGVQYNVSIITYDVNNVASPESNKVIFWCYSTPSFEFTNIFENQKIDNSSYTFEVGYSQEQDERLNEVIFVLYNTFGIEISRSESIYPNEDEIVNYTIFGFSDATNYQIQAIGQTVNGTILQTDIVPFTVSYENMKIFNLLDIQNDCNNGFIRVKNNLVHNDGKTNVEPLVYEDYDETIGKNTKLVLDVPNQYVMWDDGFSLKEDSLFTIGLWFKPTRYDTFCVLTDELNNEYKLSLVGDIYEDTDDEVSVIFQKNNDNPMLRKTYSSYELFNNLSYCFVVYSYNGQNRTHSLDFKIVTQETNTFIWDTESNLQYNRISNKFYVDGDTEKITFVQEEEQPFASTVTKLLIKNGIFDHINIEKGYENYDTTETDKPQWSSLTILDCDFNENIDGGNVDFALAEIDLLTLKRRKKNTFDWIELYKKEIHHPNDFEFLYYDYLCPSNEEFEWAIVPSFNGIDGDYIIKNAHSKFNYCFLYDITSMFKFYAETSYSNISANISIGKYDPLADSKYPIIINNSDVNYKSGSVSFALMDNNNEFNNRKEIVDISNRIMDFLTNGLSKIMKDWNGNIYLIQVVGNPSLSYNNSYGMGKINVTFNWVEQGSYDSEEDLKKNNLLV